MPRSARRLPAATAGLAVLAMLLLLAAPGQASRTVSESYTVPSGGRLQLTGHGYGHGHGMSQYGAQGAAIQGLSYGQIVAFYYPGTVLGDRVRVDPRAPHGRHRQRRAGACGPAGSGCAR